MLKKTYYPDPSKNRMNYGHSIDDDRVSSIQQSGGIALSAEL